MNLCSPWFLLFVCALAIGFQVGENKTWRRTLLVAASAMFLVPLVPRAVDWCCLAIFIAGTYASLRIIRRQREPAAAVAPVLLFVCFFVYVRKYAFLQYILPDAAQPGWLLPGIQVVGLSYMLFKFIHMAVDQHQGELAPFNFLSYASYQLSFFTLMAGPIQRYNDFSQFWQTMDSRPRDPRQTLRHWTRLLTGMVKMGAIAPLLWQWYQDAQGRVDQPAPGEFVPAFGIIFYLYFIYLYFNFSGYVDIMIAAGQMLGLELPENFNYPFLARSILDFWNRWHITLTMWVRDYIFMAPYKLAAERTEKGRRWIGYGLLFAALFVAGIWHGATGGFAVFGVIHGIGVVINQAWGDALRAVLGPKGFAKYLKNRAVELLCIFLTFHVVCFSFLYFQLGVARANLLLQNLPAELGKPGALAGLHPSLLVIALIAAVCIAAHRTLLDWASRIWSRFSAKSAALYGLICAQTAFVVVVFFVAWALEHRDPIVFYQRF
jgi:D-alanyl-lipoteichoic acid acyltransferase DltB (MBOAT superfamily)